MVEVKRDTVLGLGERLRSARKARALNLDQAAIELRLDPGILQALEEERYESLGAPVFIRGHLRAYARLLGLPEDSVIDAYRSADPGADAPPRVARQLEKPLSSTPGPLAIAAAVGIAAVAILLLFLLSAGTGLRLPDRASPEAAAPSSTGETLVETAPVPVIPPAPAAAPALPPAGPAELVPPAPPAVAPPVPAALPADTMPAPAPPPATAPAPVASPVTAPPANNPPPSATATFE